MKKLFVAMLVMSAAYVSQAAYLYWQIDNTDLEGVWTAGNATSIDVYAVNSTYENGAAQWVDGADITGGQGMSSVQQVSLGSLAGDGWSYYVELVSYNQAGDKIVHAHSSVESSYVNMVNVSIIDTNLSAIPTMNVWHGGGVAVPEPTSALMLLIGLAGLSLKRKRV